MGHFCCGSEPWYHGFHQRLGFLSPILSVCFPDSQQVLCIHLSVCSQKLQSKRESNQIVLRWLSDCEGQSAFPRMFLFPVMWHSVLKISSVCMEVWHRSSQNMNLFALTKCAEGAGAGVVQITADAVKPRVTAVMYWLDSCRSFLPSVCGR